MADRDEALHYLLSKLKGEDGWSASNLAWNEDKLSIVADQFSSFDGVAKVKVLLSFVGMTPRTISQCSKEMHQIIRLARRDGDEWVRLFASILAPFPHSQTVSVDQLMEGTMEGLAEEISNALSKQTHNSFTPHAYAYLNYSVLERSHGYTVPTGHQHFVLKKRPQASVQLRNEMLQRAGTDFSQTGSLVKDRHLLQRQLSASTAGSNPFVPTTRNPSARKSVPIPGMSNRVQRERGTKLLDIDEVPIATRRKRKVATADDSQGGRPEVKKPVRTPSKSEPDTPLAPPTTPLFTVTPDYAAGLGSEFSPAIQSPTYNPSTPQDFSSPSKLTSPGFKGHVQPLQIPKQEPPSTPSAATPTATPTPTIDKPAELPSFSGRPSAPPTDQPPPTPGASSATSKQPTKGLKLSRQQLAVAQEMFKESPSLTREQKALILGFMAGSRDNPNPSQPVVTIKLNERHEVEEVAMGTTTVKRNVLFETVFEMNYTNGQWRKLQLKRTYPVLKPS